MGPKTMSKSGYAGLVKNTFIHAKLPRDTDSVRRAYSVPEDVGKTQATEDWPRSSSGSSEDDTREDSEASSLTTPQAASELDALLTLGMEDECGLPDKAFPAFSHEAPIFESTPFDDYDTDDHSFLCEPLIVFSKEATPPLRGSSYESEGLIVRNTFLSIPPTTVGVSTARRSHSVPKRMKTVAYAH